MSASDFPAEPDPVSLGSLINDRVLEGVRTRFNAETLVQLEFGLHHLQGEMEYLRQVLRRCSTSPPKLPMKERLAKHIQRELETKPIPHQVQMIEHGRYALNILLPDPITPEVMREAVCRMVGSFNVDEFGHIVWTVSDPRLYTDADV